MNATITFTDGTQRIVSNVDADGLKDGFKNIKELSDAFVVAGDVIVASYEVRCITFSE